MLKTGKEKTTSRNLESMINSFVEQGKVRELEQRVNTAIPDINEGKYKKFRLFLHLANWKSNDAGNNIAPLDWI